MRGLDGAGNKGAATRFTWTVINAAPIADDQEVVTEFETEVAITLTASDSDALTYRIVGGPSNGVLLGTPPTVIYAPDQGFGGIDSFTFVANDGLVDSNVAIVTIYVDNTPPVSTITLEPAQPTGLNDWYTSTVAVTVNSDDGPNGSGVTTSRCVLDPTEPPASFADMADVCEYLTPTTVAADGTHTIYAAAIDVASNAELPVSRSFQIDQTPPTVTCSASPDRLWPANNKLNTINVAVNVEDATSGSASFILVSVTNDETTNANDMPGWEIGTPDTTGQLMASRAGNGDGRIYTLTYEGIDTAGNTARS